jgi:autotransporter-associated beta strand protein
MKNFLTSAKAKATLALAVLGACAAGSVNAATVVFIGTNGVSPTTNWSDTLNWIDTTSHVYETPANNEANFNFNTMSLTPGVITLNVDGGYGSPGTGTPQAWGMYFTQTNGYQTVFVQPGIIWSLQAANGTPGGGNLAIDPGTTNNNTSNQGKSPGIAYTNYTTFTGIGGTFYANTATMRIEGQASVVTNHYTIWDMSGLGTYIFTNSSLSSMNFYCSDGQTNSHVLVYLAHTNVITMNGGGQIHICNLTATSSNSQPVGMYLGQSNYIITGSSSSNLLIGGLGCLSNAFLKFNPAFIGGPTKPTAYISGVGGNQNAAICSTIGGATGGTAIADFTGGNVTWVGNTLDIGVSGSGTTNISANGTLTFDSGLVNFTNIVVGSQALSAGAPATGVVNVGTNATLQVNSKLTLGATTGTVNAATAGTINVATGGVLAASIITNGGANSTVNMTNATWTVALSSTGNTNMTVANFNAAGATNIINITSITPLLGSSLPVRFHLIAGTITGASTLGVVFPASYNPSYTYGGYLDTTSNPALVDLVLTSAPPTARSLTWTGTNGFGGTNSIGGSDSDWDVATTADWQTNGAPTIYNQYDLANFYDVTAPGTSFVNLTTTLTPFSTTVSNAASTYTLGGSGNLSGVMPLIKAGTGTLIIDNTTSNNFAGGVTISGGTLQIGTNDANGNLPAGVAVTDNGILAYDRTDVVSVGNTIAGTGVVVSAGGGTLQLAGANTYTGITLATNNSTLQGGYANSFGSSSAVVIASGSTLDPAGVAIPRPITVSGTGVGGNGAIVDSGGTILDSAAGLTPVLTLAGNTTLTFPVRWDLGSSTGAVLTNNGLGSSLTLNGATGVYYEWLNVKTDPTLANINVIGGDFGLAGATTLGNPSGALTVSSGAGLKFYNSGSVNVSVNKLIVLDDGGLIQNGGGANTITGGLVLSNANGSQYCTLDIGGTSLTVNGPLSGNGILYMQGSSAPLILNGSAAGFTGGAYIPGGSLVLNTTIGSGVTNTSAASLSGTGTVNNGAADIAGPFNPGPIGAAGTFTANAGLILEPSATFTVDLSSTTGGTNDLVAINGNLTVNGNNINVNPITGLLGAGTYTIMTYTGSLIGSFGTAQTISTSRYSISINTSTPGQVQLVVTGHPHGLTWNNGSGDGLWDVASSLNWTNFALVDEEQFFASDSVTFDDTILSAPSPVTTVTIPSGTAVYPNVVTVNSSTNYSLVGPGSIAGSATLNKQNSGNLVIATTNSFTGAVTITGGLVQVQNASALGAAIGMVSISNGATLDLDGSRIISKAYVVGGAGVGGNGALENSSLTGSIYDNPGGLTNVTLVADTTFGGPGRFDLGNAATGSTLSTSGNAYNLTFTNGLVSTYWEWENVAVDPALSNINITVGQLGLKNSTLGNPAGTVTISPSAQLTFYGGTNYPKNYHVLNGGTNQMSTNGVFNLSMTLEAGATFGSASASVIIGPTVLNGLVNFNITASSNIFSNTISGTGGINMEAADASPLILAATNTYSGPTLLSASSATVELLGGGSISNSSAINLASGTVLIAATRADGTLTLPSGQSLAGVGSVNGNLTTTPGSTLIPGTNGTGTLTVTNVVMLGGTTAMGVGAGSNNLLTCRSINYGGTLSLSFVPGSLTNGSSFKLFNASTATYTGSFASINPATPGPGLSWGTSSLNTTGTLTVVGSALPATFGRSIVSGTNLTLVGSGGVPNGTYRLYSTTNLTTPLTNWSEVATSNFDGSGNFSYPTNINTNIPSTFYLIETP